METSESVASGFIVSPMSQKIELKAGETYEGEILVAVPKAAQEDFSYEANLYPFSVSGDNYQMDFSTMSDWSRIVEWTTLENASGTLKPNEKAKIKFTIKVPETAPAGGQYAMIGISSKVDDAEATVKDQYEMASLIYAEVAGETKHGGEITENYVTGFVTSGVPEARATFVNTGNVHETAEIKMKVVNVFGGAEMQLTEDGKNEFIAMVMPESTREVVRELTDLPALGIFEVTQDVSFAGENSSMTSIVVICPVWFMVLVALMIGAIIGIIIGVVKKHHKKSII